jgi:hypothetical protein
MVSHECPERAYTYKKGCSGQERIPAFPLVGPPEQHGYSGVKPETSPDEFALTQIDDRLEPRPYGQAKGDPIEQHDAHEYWRYEAHFAVAFSRGQRRVLDSLLHASWAPRT